MLDALVDALVFGLFGFAEHSSWGQALHYFVYDTILIGTLLIVVTHVMGLINAYLPVERVRGWIASGRFRSSVSATSSTGCCNTICEHSLCTVPPLHLRLSVRFWDQNVDVGTTRRSSLSRGRWKMHSDSGHLV